MSVDRAVGGSRQARSLLALAALVLYLLPSVLGTVARMAHDAEHALESQLGAESRADGTAAPRGLVHTHGGSTHAHGPGVEALALATGGLEGSDGDDPEIDVPPVLLVAQLPPARPGVSPRGGVPIVPPRSVQALWVGPSQAPPVPPPNG